MVCATRPSSRLPLLPLLPLLPFLPRLRFSSSGGYEVLPILPQFRFCLRCTDAHEGVHCRFCRNFRCACRTCRFCRCCEFPVVRRHGGGRRRGRGGSGAAKAWGTAPLATRLAGVGHERECSRRGARGEADRGGQEGHEDWERGIAKRPREWARTPAMQPPRVWQEPTTAG